MDVDPKRSPPSHGPSATKGGQNPGESNGNDSGAADMFRQAIKEFGELKEYAAYYLAAKWDGIKLSIKRAGIFAAVGIIGLIAGGAAVVTAVVLLCTGLAELISKIPDPNQPWLGNLVVGLLLLGMMGLTIYLGLSRLNKASRQRTVEKYETRQRRQRGDFGHDVRQRSQNQS